MNSPTNQNGIPLVLTTTATCLLESPRSSGLCLLQLCCQHAGCPGEALKPSVPPSLRGNGSKPKSWGQEKATLGPRTTSPETAHGSRATFPILSRDPSFQETIKKRKERWSKRMGNFPPKWCDAQLVCGHPALWEHHAADTGPPIFPPTTQKETRPQVVQHVMLEKGLQGKYRDPCARIASCRGQKAQRSQQTAETCSSKAWTEIPSNSFDGGRALEAHTLRESRAIHTRIGKTTPSVHLCLRVPLFVVLKRKQPGKPLFCGGGVPKERHTLILIGGSTRQRQPVISRVAKARTSAVHFSNS